VAEVSAVNCAPLRGIPGIEGCEVEESWGDVMRGDCEKGLDARFDGYLSKPGTRYAEKWCDCSRRRDDLNSVQMETHRPQHRIHDLTSGQGFRPRQ
jgi:hypothetical protein